MFVSFNFGPLSVLVGFCCLSFSAGRLWTRIFYSQDLPHLLYWHDLVSTASSGSSPQQKAQKMLANQLRSGSWHSRSIPAVNQHPLCPEVALPTRGEYNAALRTADMWLMPDLNYRRQKLNSSRKRAATRAAMTINKRISTHSWLKSLVKRWLDPIGLCCSTAYIESQGEQKSAVRRDDMLLQPANWRSTDSEGSTSEIADQGERRGGFGVCRVLFVPCDAPFFSLFPLPSFLFPWFVREHA